jgi:YwiC-like protein
MLPREHGAYAQLLLPLATALAISDIHLAAVLTCISALATFVAHEPLVVLLGRRGARAQREQQRRAITWLVMSGGIAIAAGLGAVASVSPHARWLFAWPLVPAVGLAALLLAGREKSTLGEIASAVSFAAVAVPIGGLSAASPLRGFVVAFTFAGLFIVSTLGVRIVVLGSRGGGDPRAVRVTRRQLAVAVVLVGIGLSLIWRFEVRTGIAALAILPGVALAIGLAIRPPAARRLRAVGWTMVSTTALLAIALVAAFR